MFDLTVEYVPELSGNKLTLVEKHLKGRITRYIYPTFLENPSALSRIAFTRKYLIRDIGDLYMHS